MDLKARRAILDYAREEGRKDASDESLVERARAGEKRAFDALVRRHQEKVYRLALRLSGGERDAEEVLQETFLQIYRKLDSFRGESRFSTWLFRIAANGALDAPACERPAPDGVARRVPADVQRRGTARAARPRLRPCGARRRSPGTARAEAASPRSHREVARNLSGDVHAPRIWRSSPRRRPRRCSISTPRSYGRGSIARGS